MNYDISKGFHENFTILIWFTKLRNLMTIMIMNYCSKIFQSYDLCSITMFSKLWWFKEFYETMKSICSIMMFKVKSIMFSRLWWWCYEKIWYVKGPFSHYNDRSLWSMMFKSYSNNYDRLWLNVKERRCLCLRVIIFY